MSFEEICRAIDSVKVAIQSWVSEYELEMSPSFHFTGGEPLLRKDLFAIVDYARTGGFSISIMSNGTLIGADIARRIRAAQVKDVQISLDGLEAIHDHIRGKGVFKQALSGIKALIAEGVETSVNLTLSKMNMHAVQGLAALAEEVGMNSVTFSRLVPCGSGKELGSEMLTPSELADFYSGVFKRNKDLRVAVSSRDPLAIVAGMVGEIPESTFPAGGCAAGVFGITITADGTIMPCRRMDLPIGNIRHDSFRKLWAESPVLWALRDRQSYHGNCQSCIYWPVCRGCRAVALAYARSNGSEDYLGPDPQCPYYRKTSSAAATSQL